VIAADPVEVRMLRDRLDEMVASRDRSEADRERLRLKLIEAGVALTNARVELADAKRELAIAHHEILRRGGTLFSDDEVTAEIVR